MFERFTGDARATVVNAQQHSRRLGHRYIGCEHLLLALVGTDQSAAAILREHGVTPAGVEEEIVRRVGLGAGSSLFADLDRDALAAIGIDLDAVRARIEASFGPRSARRWPAMTTTSASSTSRSASWPPAAGRCHRSCRRSARPHRRCAPRSSTAAGRPADPKVRAEAGETRRWGAASRARPSHSRRAGAHRAPRPRRRPGWSGGARAAAQAPGSGLP
jgi:Clp amino terminal domain, pathogenicity island component